jgi:hypothetical protein
MQLLECSQHVLHVAGQLGLIFLRQLLDHVGELLIRLQFFFELLLCAIETVFHRCQWYFEKGSDVLLRQVLEVEQVGDGALRLRQIGDGMLQTPAQFPSIEVVSWLASMAPSSSSPETTRDGRRSWRPQ